MSDEKKTYKVNVEEKTVAFNHETKTIDGSIFLTTTFDFSNVGTHRLLYDAGTARLIKWRAGSGIKEMTTADAEAKLQNVTVDCSKVTERAPASPMVQDFRDALKDEVKRKKIEEFMATLQK